MEHSWGSCTLHTITLSEADTQEYKTLNAELRQKHENADLCYFFGLAPPDSTWCLALRMLLEPDFVVEHRHDGAGDAVLSAKVLGCLARPDPIHIVVHHHEATNTEVLVQCIQTLNGALVGVSIQADERQPPLAEMCLVLCLREGLVEVALQDANRPIVSRDGTRAAWEQAQALERLDNSSSRVVLVCLQCLCSLVNCIVGELVWLDLRDALE
mmetsp:Transcript_70731/g.186665  ORF Transcript_70731/g.186665 Transcript_70731/m.186665 type:complete len:213 (+) Transcript_70731:238-876(+)